MIMVDLVDLGNIGDGGIWENLESGTNAKTQTFSDVQRSYWKVVQLVCIFIG